MLTSRNAFAAHPFHYFPSVSCFYKAAHVQSLVLVDDQQFVTSSASNRMRIKTNEGASWLTVPVLTKGRAGQLMRDVQIVNEINWRQKHWKTLRCHYARAPYFEKYAEEVEKIFRREWKFLVDLNIAAFEFLQHELRLRCAWYCSSVWGISAGGTEKIFALARHLDSKEYVTESGNKKFLSEEKFAAAGVALTYSDYNARQYHQQYDDFVPNLSALDLLFNEGEEAQLSLM